MRELGNLHFKVNGKHKVIKTFNFNMYDDGFSFCVASELEAYQAAYVYQGSRCKINIAADEKSWHVAVYPPAMKK